ncbi:unnamed protein product [Mytilus coruscus]|uniref:Uncharacterized protein n=1 Tax=Mytilus coruscus TaxID=42192 RepID=A0A6J8DIH2_MYTCO|nr:unnamed protein product [Mytilus coruscus]
MVFKYAFYRNTRALLPSDILSSDATSTLLSRSSTPKQFNPVTTIQDEKIWSTLILIHGITESSTSAIKLSTSNKVESSYLALISLEKSSSLMNDHNTQTFLKINHSPHSKHYLVSVIPQTSTYEIKNRSITESSMQTILPASRKFSTNSVDGISTSIVSTSSPHHTIYSSSLKATNTATVTPKLVIATSFNVPRRTSSTELPIISTSDNDQSTGNENESTLKNWMKDNMLLVVGISIGIAVVLIVVVIILIYKRKKSNKRPTRPDLDPSDLFSNRRVTLLLGPDDELLPDMQPAVTHSNPLYSSVFVERKNSNFTGNRDSHFC